MIASLVVGKRTDPTPPQHFVDCMWPFVTFSCHNSWFEHDTTCCNTPWLAWPSARLMGGRDNSPTDMVGSSSIMRLHAGFCCGSEEHHALTSSCMVISPRDGSWFAYSATAHNDTRLAPAATGGSWVVTISLHGRRRWTNSVNAVTPPSAPTTHLPTASHNPTFTFPHAGAASHGDTFIAVCHGVMPYAGPMRTGGGFCCRFLPHPPLFLRGTLAAGGHARRGRVY